jgi:ATP-binding cassette subfamily F protein uup
LIQNPNFLILDEPTNDLDIVTLNVLESFLLDFPGCLLVVSHDRYFMDKIVDHLFVFRGNGVIEDFPGNYTDFRVYEDSIEPETKSTEKKEKKSWRQDDSDKLTYNEQKEYKRLEKDIQRLEEEKEKIEALFVTGELSQEEIQEKSIELQKIINESEEKTERWFELAAKIEE